MFFINHSINYETKIKNLFCNLLLINRLCFIFIISIILYLSFLVNISFAQSPADTILTRYRNSKQAQIDSVVNSYSKAKKQTWLNFLPAPTWSVRTGFGISVNTSSLSNYYQLKKANQIELERLKVEMYANLETLIQGLESKLDVIYSDIELYKIEAENFKNEQSIYKIEFGKYNNNQATLKDWLTYKNGYLSKQLQLSAKKANLKNRINSISKQIKNPVWATGLINSI
jgi:hypothetical protein